ncbi:hypothetical protein IPZ61_26810 [Streptomyces sioyaensis]|uniref:hypothetical protein n=1 Tax=Streptomyces sioyaensis TaxID=67364 RepID=UPI001F1656E0|nr:hypothetical protein [Streptomyces sioyaensis]MCF3176919.1 hypothetical protein [Streptomyces sioyaensis]
MAQQQSQERHGTPVVAAPTGAAEGRGVDPWAAVFREARTVAGTWYACTASLAARPVPGGAR